MEEKDEIKVRDLSDQGKGKYYYDNSIYYDEMYIAEKINKLKNNHYQTNEERVEQWINNFCQKKDIVLSTGQYDAVKNIVSQGFSILTGGPGCGKTTTTRVLVMLLLAMKKKVFLCAPTGRAAQRMTDVIGVEAKTIHRLLEWDISNGGFKKKQSNELDCSFLIVDECSMLDVHLAAALLRAVKNKAQVLFIGDADQLPSVGAGNIFKDIISSEVVPVYRLTEVFRQAKESSIIRHAHQINSGFVPRIESPFYRPQLWQESEDCLFIDSDEATQEQLSFVKKVKYLAEKRRTYKVQEKKDAEKYFNKDKDNSIDKIHESLYTEDEEISIPDKFQHVNIEQLMDAKSSTEELRYILKKVHPWSSLNYGYTALPIIEKIYTQTIPKYFGKNAEIQILTPMTRGSLGTISLNKVIQEKANPLRTGISQIQLGDRIFRIGDRVIQKRNNYDLDVFNGDIGIIRSVDTENLNLSIEFKTGLNHKVVHYEKDSLAEIDLAYAITIHKSQGSEFEFIIIPLFTQHFSMLFRNLVYTGLTRAKKMAIFVGNRKALSMSVRNNKTKVRQTTLDFLLKQTSID
jgi:exodeoxyribonuclease V alpha subunit